MAEQRVDSSRPPYTAVGDPLVDFDPLPLWELLSNSASEFPERTSIIFRDARMNYRELDELTKRAATGLQKLGICAGDRVGICMPNHPISVVMFFATMRSGAVVVMMNPIYAAPALIGQAIDSGLSLLITLDDATLLSKVEDVARQAHVNTILVGSPNASQFMSPEPKKAVERQDGHIDLMQIIAAEGEPSVFDCNPIKTLAAIQYSGGTTGAPKGVMLTHGNLHAGIRQFQSTLPMLGFGTEVILAAAPFFHISGMNGVLGPAIAWAATILIIDRFDASETAKSCIANGVTYFAAVPTMFFALTDVSEALSLKWPELKCAVSGGAPLPEAVKARFEAVIGKPLLHAYGLTECSPPVSMPPQDRSVPAACCGQVVPGTEIQIRSSLTVAEILPAGQVGELCVRGPQVTSGYWQRPELNKEAFIDGFVRTGDLAYLTEDRLLYLVDRLKDIIICSGYNVYPVRVEEALFQHPSISEAIVLGVPDPYRGETVKAFVTLRDGRTLTLDELQSFLSPLLSPIEMPKQMEIRKQLPRSAVGKLSRLKLREEVLKNSNGA